MPSMKNDSQRGAEIVLAAVYAALSRTRMNSCPCPHQFTKRATRKSGQRSDGASRNDTGGPGTRGRSPGAGTVASARAGHPR